MRRIVLLLSAFMFMAVAPANAQTKKGDLNGDGNVDRDDVLCLVYKVLGFDEGTNDYDVNEDGTVDITDVTSLVSIIVSNQQAEPLQTCPDDNHPHVIDLGLPSGTKWACCNVGASSPEKCGYYYAWGETEEKDWYLRKTYIYYDADEDKYIDLGDIRGTEYDAAHLKWGGAWRMPTWEESEEIFDLVRRQQYVNGIKMEVFVGPNGNSIQIPYTDCQWALYNQELESEWPMFWTSILNDSKIFAYKGGGSQIRYSGLPIRPVYDPSFFFSLSEETVDMFVNSTTSVSIEMGSGEYELQYDQTDIIDAELIMADKEEYPDAKDEISIYGVAEGTAQLKVVDKKCNKTVTIDVNVKTPTDDDLATTKDYVERVRNYINSQKELEIYTFQNNLISWLEEQSWVKNVNVDYDNDVVPNTFPNSAKRIIQQLKGRLEQIAITFENSFYFSILFYDTDLCDDGEDLDIWDSPYDLIRDMSSVKGEEIIDTVNVLHLQCREMPNFQNNISSTESQESNSIDQYVSLSPVNFKIKRYTYRTKIFSFLDENFSNYGMILLSQTHGTSGGFGPTGFYAGAFQVENIHEEDEGVIRGLTLLIKNGEISVHEKDPIVYWILPKAISKLNIKEKTIFHGCYCYSYYLQRMMPQTTYYGYNTIARYQEGTKNLIEFFKNMSFGLTYENAISSIIKTYPIIHNGENVNVVPATNRPNSKQRYFSISTDDVTEYTVSGPIITGKIKGYKNLKSGINYYVYVSGKGEKLDPADITTNGKRITIKKDGTFRYEYSDLITESPEVRQYAIGFKYGGITYRGAIKTLVTKSKSEDEQEDNGICPDANHPHWIDLDLPSGTLWRCCNEGASRPEEYGDYYTFGQMSSAPSLNQVKELLNNTTYSGWSVLNGVYGGMFIGSNGNKIFLPRAGYRWSGSFFGKGQWGVYWTSMPNDEVGAYDLEVYKDCATWSTIFLDYAQSVRPAR